MMAIAMIAAFVVNLLLGLPLFLCLLLTALVGFLFVDPALFANTLPQRFFGGMDIFSLMAIPLFVLAGNLMNHSGMTPRLMRLANALVGHFRGGLGHVNVVAGCSSPGSTGPPRPTLRHSAPCWCRPWKRKATRGASPPG